MFEFNPNLIEEDDEEAGEDVVCYHGSDDEVGVCVRERERYMLGVGLIHVAMMSPD